MAKKKTEDIEKLKSDLKKAKDSAECYSSILGIIAILTVLAGLFYGIQWLTSDTPLKYNVGTCLLNRHYETVIVSKKYEYLREYSLEYLKVEETYNGWKLVWDVDKYLQSYTKSAEYVENSYTEIPCKSKDI